MSEFYLPYQFIPASGTINGTQQKTSYEAIKAGSVDPPARHDLWMPGTHSGRIVCKLQLETPTFVGAAQTKNTPTGVHPYKWNGRSAIPGNSLRGMIGSVIETLSQSALRVLEDWRYSVRKRDEDAISAVGMLQKSGDTFDILPLTLPIMKSSNSAFLFEAKWVQAFEGVPLEECLPAYVPGYDTSGQTVQYSSLLESCAAECSGLGEGQRFHAQLCGTLTGTVTKQTKVDPAIHHRSRNSYLSARNLLDIRKNSREGFLPGYLQILELCGRRSGPLKRKKYALFVPAPKTQRKALPVPYPVLDNFKNVIEERSRDSDGDFPIFPKAYPRPGEEGEWPLDNMLVFFDIGYLNGELVVTELSFSAIWREAVQPSAWDLFSALGRDNGIGRDLLPWRGERTHLTPAERLLGVVEEDKGEQARCLTSRLRFSDAQLKPEESEEKLRLNTDTLKILASPKPPSPALYLHLEGDSKEHSYLPKWRLKKLGVRVRIRPNGRKFYLHHPHDAGVLKIHYKTESGKHPDQKLRCAPIEPGKELWFHIDFDNLSPAELNLVVTALRPSEAFRHKLGLGKPLGLGSVELCIEGVFFIDRGRRYGINGFNAPRYHTIWRPQASDTGFAWRYPEEANALSAALPENAGWRDRDELIDGETLGKLIKLGCPPPAASAPVHYPLTRNQSTSTDNDKDKYEKELYRWFDQGDREPKRAQTLAPIVADAPLPTLSTYCVMLEVENLPDGNPEELQERLRDLLRGHGRVHRVLVDPPLARILMDGDAAARLLNGSVRLSLDGQILKMGRREP